METTLKLLLLALTLTLLLCANPAAGISCHSCKKDKCGTEETQQCPKDDDWCMTLTINKIINGQSTISYSRMCAPSHNCPDVSLQPLSITTSLGTVITNVECCNTMNCNSGAPPAPSAPYSGAQKCPGCYPNGPPCPNITCGTLETHCFFFEDWGWKEDKTNTVAVFGCASQGTCESSIVKTELHHVLIGKKVTLGMMFCKPMPVTVCELCVDPCQKCSKTSTISAPSGMKCMSATITGSDGQPKHLKGLAGPPLSSHEGSLSYPGENSGTNVKVKTCSTNNCNKDAPDEDAPLSPDISADVLKQVKQLTQSIVFISPEPPAEPPAAPPAEHGHNEGEVHE